MSYSWLVFCDVEINLIRTDNQSAIIIKMPVTGQEYI